MRKLCRRGRGGITAKFEKLEIENGGDDDGDRGGIV